MVYPAAVKAASRKPSTTPWIVSSVGKRELQVDLGELRLAVGAQILVAEAARNLEVAVEAADHQQLLEDLRRLRQCVELAGMDAARDEVIARALGRRARHVRRLNLVEALARKIVADGQCDAVAHLDVGVHLRTAQVEVAIFQPHLFI